MIQSIREKTSMQCNLKTLFAVTIGRVSLLGILVRVLNRLAFAAPLSRTMLLFGIVGSAWSGWLPAQERLNQQTGLFELDSPHLRLITDVPFDEELRRWPSVIDQCLEQWAKYFNSDIDTRPDAKVTVYLIGDPQRFQAAGYLANLPRFEDGYQAAASLYLREQPSEYYRRHLLIHEATHWVMWRLYGGAGSAWFMEGMADMQGTHQFKDGVLTLNLIPVTPQQVPYWGRLKLIDLSLKEERAPSLSDIFAFENMQENRMDRYSWSWAACVFFTNHPTYAPILSQEYQGGLDYSLRLSHQFRARLEEHWDAVQTDWNAFVTDLDFGYDVSRSMVVTADPPMPQPLKSDVRFKIKSDRGWQSTGIVLSEGQAVSIQCEGTYRLRDRKNPAAANIASSANKSWIVQPQGITIEYVNGHPLGCVLAAVAPMGGPEETKRWNVHRVGKSNTLSAEKPGILFLKINEASMELSDNLGEISAVISPLGPE